MVTCGDFLQLPPVKKEDEEDLGDVDAPDFAFQTTEWADMFPVEHTIYLEQVFRQVDAEFAGMLEEIRKGKVSESTIASILELDREISYKDGVEPTEM